MKQSRTKDIFILGFAMFAIFFGAGNLIFPPSIGIHSGGDVVWGIAGMTLTGIIFPMLAMYAGLGAVLGHNYPFYMKFKGGKGIAVTAGIIITTWKNI